MTTGIVSALHNDIDVQISASIGKGSSGAPVFNFEGHVVAIVNGFLTTGQNMNFAINVNRLKYLLSHLITAQEDTTTSNTGSARTGPKKLFIAPSSGALTIPQWVAQQLKEEEAAAAARRFNQSGPLSPGFSIRKIFMDIHDLTKQIIWGRMDDQDAVTHAHSNELNPLKFSSSNKSVIAKPSSALIEQTKASEDSCAREGSETKQENKEKG